MEYIHYYDSPLGGIILTSDGEALTGLWFEGKKHFMDSHSRNCEEKKLPVFEKIEEWLDTYFCGKDPGFTPPLKIMTSTFGKAVCEIMLTIPFGQTMTYGEIAKIIAKQKGLARMSAQAVGGAVGRNPISLVVPCHRVVGANGNLTGYGGGIDRKMSLLALEKADISKFFIPKKGNAL